MESHLFGFYSFITNDFYVCEEVATIFVNFERAYELYVLAE